MRPGGLCRLLPPLLLLLVQGSLLLLVTARHGRAAACPLRRKVSAARGALLLQVPCRPPRSGLVPSGCGDGRGLRAGPPRQRLGPLRQEGAVRRAAAASARQRLPGTVRRDAPTVLTSLGADGRA